MRWRRHVARTVGGLLIGASATAAPTHECRVAGLAHAVQCGSVRRALDPARPAGPAIDVAFVVVPALARRKLPDPVFLLAGGPGQSAIDLASQMQPVFARLNNRRDLVFVDQRGTGRSAPLVCDDPADGTLPEQADTGRQLDRLAACRAGLRRLPYVRADADLGFFTTTLAMQDLDAVRRALGAERIDLVGVSYGTRAALEYLRQFPTAVRRGVLDAVAPPDMALPASVSTDGQAALDSLFADCEAAIECRRRHPTLRAGWHALVAALPRTVTAREPLTGRAETFMLTRRLLVATVRAPLYAPSAAAGLPEAIDAAAAGRFEPLFGLASMLSGHPGPPQLAMGMHFSVVCAEDMPLLDAGAPGRDADPPGADFGTVDVDFYRAACARWPRGAVPAAFHRLGASAAPMLLLSGGLDPATPPRHAARVAAALGASAQSVVVPNAAHGVLATGCVRDIVYRFIDGGDDRVAPPVAAGCIEAVPRAAAFVPVGATPAP